MAAPAEVQAAMIMVAGEWARYLESIAIDKSKKNEKTVLDRLFERYKLIIEELKVVQPHF